MDNTTTWNRVGIFLPTYGRSDTKLPKCLKSAFETVRNPKDIYCVFVVNFHDKGSKEVAKALCDEFGIEHEFVLENLQRPHLAKFFNQCFTRAANRDPQMIVSMTGDDFVYCTPGWERRIIDEVNAHNGVGLFYCAGDERFSDALCVNAFMTRKFVQMCSCQFMCEFFQANSIDVIWQKAAEAADLDYYLEDVVILHEQCSRLHIGFDATYERLKGSRNQAIKNRHHEPRYINDIVRALKRSGLPTHPWAHHMEVHRPGRHYLSEANGDRIIQPDGTVV